MSTELAVLNQFDTRLAELVEYKKMELTDLQDKSKYELIKRARITVKNFRLEVTKASKAAQQPHKDIIAKIKDRESELVNQSDPIETHLEAEEKKYTDEQDRLEAERQRILQERYDGRVVRLKEMEAYQDGPYFIIEDATVQTGQVAMLMEDVKNLSDDHFEEWIQKAKVFYKKIVEGRELLSRFNDRKAALIERGYKINEAKNEIADADDIIGLAWLETTDDITFNGLLDNIDAVIANRKELEAAEQKRKEDELAEARRQVEAAKEEIRASRQMVINQLSDKEKALVEKRTFIGKSLINDLDDFSAADFTEFIALIKEEAAFTEFTELANHPYPQAVPVHEDDNLNKVLYEEAGEELLQQEDEPQAEYGEPKMLITQLVTPEVLAFFRTLGSIYHKGDAEALHLPQALLIEDNEVYLLTPEETNEIVETTFLTNKN